MAYSVSPVRWSFGSLGRWLLDLLASLAFSGVLVGPVDADSLPARSFPGQLTLQDEKLTVRIIGVPLDQVMEEIGRLTGAQVFWLTKERAEPVSVQFVEMPLAEALRRILKAKNFMLFYASQRKGAQVSQIWISSWGKTGEPLLFSQQFTSTVMMPSGVSPVPAGQEAHDAMPLNTLLSIATRNQDLALRLQAIARLGQYVQDDARVEAILSELAHNDTNSQVQEAAAEALAGLEEDNLLQDVHQRDAELSTWTE